MGIGPNAIALLRGMAVRRQFAEKAVSGPTALKPIVLNAMTESIESLFFTHELFNSSEEASQN
jgi:hypothetical protein